MKKVCSCYLALLLAICVAVTSFLSFPFKSQAAQPDSIFNDGFKHVLTLTFGDDYSVDRFCNDVLHTTVATISQVQNLTFGNYYNFMKTEQEFSNYWSNNHVSYLTNSDGTLASITLDSDFTSWAVNGYNEYYGISKEKASDYYDSSSGCYIYDSHKVACKTPVNGSYYRIKSGYFYNLKTSKPLVAVLYSDDNVPQYEQKIMYYTLDTNNQLKGFTFSTSSNASVGEICCFSTSYYASSGSVSNSYQYGPYYGQLTNSSWTFSCLKGEEITELSSSIPFYDSYESAVDALTTGSYTGAFNYASLSNVSGRSITLTANDISEISSKIDSSNEYLSETNILLEKIKGILEEISNTIKNNIESVLNSINDKLGDILGAVQSIRRWSIADTLFDGFDFLKDLLSDLGNWGISAIKSPVSALASMLELLEPIGEALKVKFPFCIPWDIAFLFNLLKAEPLAPCYEIPITLERFGVSETLILDLNDFSIISKISRTLLTIIFSYGLLHLTMKIVDMKEKENQNA